MALQIGSRRPLKFGSHLPTGTRRWAPEENFLSPRWREAYPAIMKTCGMETEQCVSALTTHVHTCTPLAFHLLILTCHTLLCGVFSMSPDQEECCLGAVVTGRGHC